MSVLTQQIEMLDSLAPHELHGTVSEVRGLAVRVTDLPIPIGASVLIRSGRSSNTGIRGEVVGFDNQQTIIMPFGTTEGIQRGGRVTAIRNTQTIRVGETLLGRVLDGMGNPIDGRGPLVDTTVRSLNPPSVDALDRPVIDQPLATGVRAVDALISMGRGQRMGVFAAPGVGKSTLLGTMAKHTAADVSVIALVGERGREVRDFIEHVLGPEGLARSVVVVATSDQPPLVRIRSAFTATAIAEHFRDSGLDVLLLMDSVTRFCQAQRQVGLSIGEPPATKGYPPSVFSMLPSLLERAGRTSKGSITGLYAVLVEGDDMNEPVSDACRGILDGHILLSRQLAERGHYPAIDVLASVSRVLNDVTRRDQQAARREVIKLMSAYRQVEDLLNIGAYAQGSNPDFDLAIACRPAIDALIQQGRGEVQGMADFARTKAQLLALVQQIDQAKAQLAQGARRGQPGMR